MPKACWLLLREAHLGSILNALAHPGSHWLNFKSSVSSETQLGSILKARVHLGSIFKSSSSAQAQKIKARSTSTAAAGGSRCDGFTQMVSGLLFPSFLAGNHFLGKLVFLE